MSRLALDHALAVHQYVRTRALYRSYNAHTRPGWVYAAYEGAKRRLDKVRGLAGCESPHLQNSPERCGTCMVPCFYHDLVILLPPSSL